MFRRSASVERDKNGYFENDLNIQDDILRCIASDWLLHTHTHLQTRLRTRNASGVHRSERRTILFASSSKPYCLQKVKIKFILMLLLLSALARFVVGVFLISQLHTWTTFLPLLLHF